MLLPPAAPRPHWPSVHRGADGEACGLSSPVKLLAAIVGCVRYGNTPRYSPPATRVGSFITPLSCERLSAWQDLFFCLVVSDSNYSMQQRRLEMSISFTTTARRQVATLLRIAGQGGHLRRDTRRRPLLIRRNLSIRKLTTLLFWRAVFVCSPSCTSILLLRCLHLTRAIWRKAILFTLAERQSSALALSTT